MDVEKKLKLTSIYIRKGWKAQAQLIAKSRLTRNLILACLKCPLVTKITFLFSMTSHYSFIIWSKTLIHGVWKNETFYSFSSVLYMGRARRLWFLRYLEKHFGNRILKFLHIWLFTYYKLWQIGWEHQDICRNVLTLSTRIGFQNDFANISGTINRADIFLYSKETRGHSLYTHIKHITVAV